MQKGSLFNPNSTNFGGFNQISQQHYNHKKALRSPKAVVGSLVPPRPHVNEPKDKYFLSPRTMNGMNGMSGMSGMNGSYSSDSFRKTNLNRSVNKFTMNEHQRELNLLKDKVRSIETATPQSRRNKNTLYGKPVILFRDKNKKTPSSKAMDDIDAGSFYQRETYQFFNKMYQMPSFNSMRSTISSKPEPERLDGMALYESEARRDVNRIIKKWQPEEVETEENPEDNRMIKKWMPGPVEMDETEENEEKKWKEGPVEMDEMEEMENEEDEDEEQPEEEVDQDIEINEDDYYQHNYYAPEE